jgi:excinuclease UvrABC nuclease subunit
MRWLFDFKGIMPTMACNDNMTQDDGSYSPRQMKAFKTETTAYNELDDVASMMRITTWRNLGFMF